MSQHLPRYTNQPAQTTVSHTRRPRTTHYEPTTTGNTNPTPHRIYTHSPEDLRGIPCLAPGVGGTSPHTNPLAETIRRNP